MTFNKEYNLDVWHATPTNVDIYTSSLPSELAEAPHKIVSVPPLTRPLFSYTASPQRLTDDAWNLSTLNTSFHETYHPLDGIYSFFDQLVARFPEVTKMVEMGRSAEGRRIMGLSISTGRYGSGGPGVGKMEADEDDSMGEDSLKKKKKKKKKTHRPPLRDTEKLGFVIIGAQHAREVSI